MKLTPMTVTAPAWLWAVHVSDGVLDSSWLVAGYVVAAALAVFGSRRLRDEEIPQIALLAAAFFVASLVHVRVGPTSVHLLLNGLLGVVLGSRACLAIPTGLLLQAVLIGHGGFSALGVNSCVLGIPALVAGWLSVAVQQVPWAKARGFRTVMVALSLALWTLALVYSLALLATNGIPRPQSLDTDTASAICLHPAVVCAIGVVATFGAWVARRMENVPEFPLGLLVGSAAVLLTLILNGAALYWGGGEDWHGLVLLLFVAHLPIAVLEGLVLGFTLSFLARVKPEMIRRSAVENTPCPADVLV